MGECPDWYSTIRAAKYLGVPPWELLDQPAFWRNAALTAESTEVKYQELEQQRSKG